MIKGKDRSKQEAMDILHKVLQRGDTVYTVLRHVSKSGMQRRIDCYCIGEDRKPFFLSGYIGKVLGLRHDFKKGGLVVNGCGMDMGFHIVHSLSSAMFRGPNGEYSHEGAYALKHEWI